MYGIIGNGETCAFISIFDSLDWLCLPRFDSPTLFARALDSENGGSITLWYETGGSILPFETGKQTYVEDTNVLETSTGVGDDIVRTIDFMPFGERRLWRIMGVSGPQRFRLTLDIDPRPDYNRASPEIAVKENGVLITGPGQALFISSTEPATIKKRRISFDVEPPRTIPLLLTYGETPDDCLKAAERQDFVKDYRKQVEGWRRWSARANPVFELSPRLHYFYMRSLLILKLLIYDRTGAILAAPTTSFPEIVGRDANWDYRFCWVRDGAYSAEALALAGMRDDSRKLLDFLLGIVSGDGKPYPYPLVSVDGTLEGTDEVLIDTLAGFGNSRPVRIGNKAVGQRQNDLEGEVVHAIYMYDRYSGDTKYAPDHFDRIARIVDYVRATGERRTRASGSSGGSTWTTYTARPCAGRHWSTARRSPTASGTTTWPSDWREEACIVRDDVLTNGWSERKKCFKRSYQDDAYDASVLAVPLMNMLPVDDPKVRMSVKSITDHLGTGGLLKRFEEEPHAFMLSSLWLAQVMMKRGKAVTALDIINRAARYASSDLGLFAEEYDMYYQRLVGNIPQSFSHEEFVKSIQFLLGKE